MPLTSKTASTVARSAPARTTPDDARSPSRRERAPTTMDLPAPVSPESTLSPAPSSRLRSSTTA